MRTATLPIEAIVPPLRVDEYGAVRVGKTQVTLPVLLESYKLGRSPEELVEEFSTLTLAEVYGAISYYLHHREATDAYLDELDRQWKTTFKEIEAQPGYHESRRRLLERAKNEG
jgi:uncharacterized protein (DUF433 family)